MTWLLRKKDSTVKTKVHSVGVILFTRCSTNVIKISSVFVVGFHNLLFRSNYVFVCIKSYVGGYLTEII